MSDRSEPLEPAEDRNQLATDPGQYVALPREMWEALARNIGQIPTQFGYSLMKILEFGRLVSLAEPKKEP